MRKGLLMFSCLSAISVLVVGCNGGESEPEAASPTSTETPETVSHDLELGKTLRWSGGSVVIDSVTSYEDCGFAGDPDDKPAEGQRVVVIEGTMTLSSEADDVPDSPRNEPLRVARPGDVIEIDDSPCATTQLRQSNWDLPLHPGDIVDLHAEGSIPASATHLVITAQNERWLVPIEEGAAEPTTTAPEPTPESQTSAPVSQRTQAPAPAPAAPAAPPPPAEYWCDSLGTYTSGPSTCPAPQVTQAPNTPSPWVQGQIDWQNCLDAGNTADTCRALLN